ncbi:hypothetical protein AYI69_g11120 [Smittium culicis]|uniref:Uncharacterized protein n=1 Tax=Smittium culicis TaxID=133412 RepID=A0A1R1X130_9FUNG|nr:hypothetical protein AYI69_g11120 [Smittium culicis]
MENYENSIRDGYSIRLVREFEDLINGISEIVYETNVITRYKSVTEKIKPVAIKNENFESPGLNIEKHRYFRKNEEVIRDKILSIKIGDENLNSTEKEYFQSCLLKNSRAFAFDSKEMGLLNISIESPVTVETINHIPWMHKQTYKWSLF